MSPLEILILLSLAAFRATRLITDDRLTLPARAWIAGRFPKRAAVQYFITCPWCVGMWISAALVLLVWYWQPLPLPGLWIPAVAAIAGMLGARFGE